MAHFAFLFLTLFYPYHPPPAYQAIVVDATTSRPLASVNIVAWAASITDVVTVMRRDYSKPWSFRQQNRDSRKTDNPDISLTILAE